MQGIQSTTVSERYCKECILRDRHETRVVMRMTLDPHCSRLLPCGRIAAGDGGNRLLNFQLMNGDGDIVGDRSGVGLLGGLDKLDALRQRGLLDSHLNQGVKKCFKLAMYLLCKRIRRPKMNETYPSSYRHLQLIGKRKSWSRINMARVWH